MNTIARFVEMLKAHLADNEGNYVVHNPWFGDTESGFEAVDEFDFAALLKEIDEFSETFKATEKAKKENP